MTYAKLFIGVLTNIPWRARNLLQDFASLGLLLSFCKPKLWFWTIFYVNDIGGLLSIELRYLKNYSTLL